MNGPPIAIAARRTRCLTAAYDWKGRMLWLTHLLLLLPQSCAWLGSTSISSTGSMPRTGRIKIVNNKNDCYRFSFRTSSFISGRPVAGPSTSQLAYSGSLENFDSTVGLNELHTLLRDAVAQEDYGTTGKVSNELATRIFTDFSKLSSTEQRARRREMSWVGLGAAPWLTDRLESLNYTFPTTIQINAFFAANAILRENDATVATASDSTTSPLQSSSLERRVNHTQAMDMGIVVSGTTGSGKTLSYAVPLLSTLSDSLFVRQRLRVSDEEAVGDTMGDLVDRISVVTSP